MTLRPCVDCGEPTEGARCPDHRIKSTRIKPPPAARGYDWQWAKLSRRARAMQPFCTDCGATTDLECDHTPTAWERKAKGLPIRLSDVAVVCGECNRSRGAARGANVRQRGSQTPGA